MIFQRGMGPFFYLAMDFKKRDEMRQRADQIAHVPGNWGFKVNDDYIDVVGHQTAVDDFRPYGRSLFFDKKLLKGSRRMINIVKELNEIGGVDFTNIFAIAAGDLKKTIDATKDGPTKILTLTLLTHMSDEECRRIFRRSFPSQVKILAEIAQEAGSSGALIPGTCLKACRDLQLIKTVTAIRPEWYVSKKANPQKQDVTHQFAVKNGAEIIIGGSPVWDTPSPVDSLKRILEEMQNTWIGYT